MRFSPAFLAAGLALCSPSDAAESSAPDANVPLSPIRQYLRDSVKVPPLVAPIEPATKPAMKSPDTPVVLPAFHVTDRSPVQVFDQVNGLFEQKVRLQSQSPALFKTDRLEILNPPKIEPGPAGMPRVRLNILKFRW